MLQVYALHCACAVQANQAYKQICANSKGEQCDIGRCVELVIQMKHKDYVGETKQDHIWGGVKADRG